MNSTHGEKALPPLNLKASRRLEARHRVIPTRRDSRTEYLPLHEPRLRQLGSQVPRGLAMRRSPDELRERDFIAPHGESPGALSEDLGTQRIADETLGLRKLLLNCASSAEEVEYRPTALSR